MNKVEIKKNSAKIKGCMWCQLLYIIPGAILCSKFNYSDVTSMKPPLPQSFSFCIFYRENLQKWKIYSRNAYILTSIQRLLPLYAPVRFRLDSCPPTCVHTLWMPHMRKISFSFTVSSCDLVTIFHL